MPVSKRLRYEVLRRDNHTCRYCGASAPDVQLTVDHVIPVTLGGSDDPSNLVAACRPCNAGKTSTAPDAPLISDVEQDAVRWAAAMKAAAEIQKRGRDERRVFVEAFVREWDQWTPIDGSYVPLDDSWVESIERFHDLGLEVDVLESAIGNAMNRPIPRHRVWKYFCGICWKLLRERAEIARELLAESES